MKSKKRAKKDPNAPKKALSAYMFWLNATREQIKKDHPGISITELSKKAGVLWKALDDKSVCILFVVEDLRLIILPLSLKMCFDDLSVKMSGCIEFGSNICLMSSDDHEFCVLRK